MRIAYVYDAVYPWETGGVQKRVWELARRLAKDHDVHWYGYRYWDGEPVRQKENVTLHGVAPPRELYEHGRRSISQALDFSVHLVRPLLRDDFDVIDCQEFPYFPGFPSKLGACVNDARLFVTWHEVWGEYWYEYLGWKGGLGRLVERVVARLPNAHIAVSHRTQDDLRTIGVGSSHYVPNGIDLAEIEEISPANISIDALFVGRLIPEKNPRLLVRTFANILDENPDFRAVIVGEGPEQTRVEDLIHQYQLDEAVSLLPFQESHDDILAMMKAASVFVLPSRREGFGITVLEALACGTPVVTIDHPQNAATELIDEGMTGVIATPTAEGIAEGIAGAATLSSAACKSTAKEYEWDRIASDIEEVYRDRSSH